MVSQKERVERVEGGLSEEGTMKIGWVCACARAFARERGAPGTKPSRQGSVFDWGWVTLPGIDLGSPKGGENNVFSINVCVS